MEKAAVYVAFKEMLCRVADVQQRWNTFRRSFGEKLCVEIGPWDVGKFFDEVIDRRCSRHIVERVNVERSDQGFGELSV